MKEQELDQTITATLWRFMLSYRYGSIKHIEKTMGVPMDALRTAKNGRFGLRVRHVTGAIKAMGIPPTVFFNEALGGGVTTTAEERFIARGALLAARKRVDLPVMAEETKPDRLTEDDLERLDAMRFEDPRAAAEQAAGVARQAARDGRRGDAAAAVARQGSALRVAEQWEPAWACVWWALKNAPEGPIRADALRRSASVVSDFGQFEDAADLADAAGIEYKESGDVAGVGRALLGRGLFLRSAGNFQDAIRLLKAAGAFLPPDDHLSHVSLQKGLSHTYVSLEEFDTAEGHAEVAQSISGIPEALAVDMLWLRARITAGRQEYEIARVWYEKTIQALERSPGNAALASAELCKVYLRAGHAKRAVGTASAMARFAIPRSQNRVVAAAILDLYRSARAGKLTMVLVERTIKDIGQALKQRATIA